MGSVDYYALPFYMIHLHTLNFITNKHKNPSTMFTNSWYQDNVTNWWHVKNEKLTMKQVNLDSKCPSPMTLMCKVLFLCSHAWSCHICQSYNIISLYVPIEPRIRIKLTNFYGSSQELRFKIASFKVRHVFISSYKF
mgnify:CR=1 FL=1